MRKVYVEATWTSSHTIEVPDEAELINELDTLLDYEDIDSSTASLTDWTISDPDA